MAYICTKPPGHCVGCDHYRFIDGLWDTGYGAKACFAELDERDKRYIQDINRRTEE